MPVETVVNPPDAHADLGPTPTGTAAVPPRPRRGRGLVIRAAALLVLLAVFASYLSPHLALDLANRLWACFG